MNQKQEQNIKSIIYADSFLFEVEETEIYVIGSFDLNEEIGAFKLISFLTFDEEDKPRVSEIQAHMMSNLESYYGEDIFAAIENKISDLKRDAAEDIARYSYDAKYSELF